MDQRSWGVLLLTLGGLGLLVTGVAAVRHLALGDSPGPVGLQAGLLGLVSASATLRGYRQWRHGRPDRPST